MNTSIQKNRVVYDTGKMNWSTFIFTAKRLHRITQIDGYQKVTLDLSNITHGYPNGFVPLIAEVHRLYAQGITFTLVPPKDLKVRSLFERYGWIHYLNPENGMSPPNGTARVGLRHFGTDEELNDLVNRAIEICLEEILFAGGVAQAFEWVLNEIAGNVLVHAKTEYGWMQVVPYPDNHKLSLIVCDTGQGIPGAMRSAFDFRYDQEALEMAMRKGITSNPEHGQGNGLAGAVSIAQESGGSLSITSFRGRVRVANGNIQAGNWYPPYLGTCVEMQFQTDEVIDLPKALWGHETVSYTELHFEDELGDLVFRLRDYASSFGNRITGEKIRTLVLNLLRQSPGHSVLIQMDDIGIISSSFADELFGKLMVELGALDFTRTIKVSNLNPWCKNIIDRAIGQRMAQTFMK